MVLVSRFYAEAGWVAPLTAYITPPQKTVVRAVANLALLRRRGALDSLILRAGSRFLGIRHFPNNSSTVVRGVNKVFNFLTTVNEE